MKTNEVSFEEMNCKFYYDDGKLYWKCSTSTKIRNGDLAGTPDKDGYIRIQTNGKTYSAHRIIWVLHNKSIDSSKEIDHIDRDVTNNRIENLRLVNGAINRYNIGIKVNNTSGVTGVYYLEHCNRWQAKLGKNNLGYFKNKDDAISARIKAEVAVA